MTTDVPDSTLLERARKRAPDANRDDRLAQNIKAGIENSSRARLVGSGVETGAEIKENVTVPKLGIVPQLKQGVPIGDVKSATHAALAQEYMKAMLILTRKDGPSYKIELVRWQEWLHGWHGFTVQMILSRHRPALFLRSVWEISDVPATPTTDSP